MDAEDWLKGVEKKLVIAQCTDHEKVLFTAHQLYGTAANWWETYCNTHANVDTITSNKFKAVIPRFEKEGTKPPYVCPGCSNHTHGNNMINRCNAVNKRVIFLT
jgi:hypothetical protein